jgi:queuine tRNA-ribosyltransferase
MQLDECVALPNERAAIDKAMQLSLRWAERSKRAFEAQPEGRALFGIVQGGDQPDLRIASARALSAMDFPGYSIGGLAVGEPQEVMLAMIEAVMPHLPDDKPHYLMGVGTPDDLLAAVARGVDMFDCVMPTRNGRHGQAFTRFGKVNFRNARHADDPRPARRDLVLSGGPRLFQGLPAPPDPHRGDARLHADHLDQPRLLPGAHGRGARGHRRGDRFADYAAEVREGWARGDIAPWQG